MGSGESQKPGPFQCAKALEAQHSLISLKACYLTPEHGSELFRYPLEQLLDGCRIADESGRHLEAARRDVADGRLHVVRDPLDKVGRVLVLDVEHLFVDLLHRHATAEDGGYGEVATVARVARRHHVLRVEHLLRQLWHGQG